MARGRPPKIVDMMSAKIGKQKTLNRKRQEADLKIDRDTLDGAAPDWLDDEAKAEFRRVVSEAKKISLFDNLDFSVLAVYCAAYSQFIQAHKAIAEEGAVVGDKVSPWVGVADKAATQILKCSGKLGLAITDRLRLIVPTKNEVKGQNKFLDFIPAKRREMIADA